MKNVQKFATVKEFTKALHAFRKNNQADDVTAVFYKAYEGGNTLVQNRVARFDDQCFIQDGQLRAFRRKNIGAILLATPHVEFQIRSVR